MADLYLIIFQGFQDVFPYTEIIKNNYPSKNISENHILIFTSDDVKQIHNKFSLQEKGVIVLVIKMNEYWGRLTTDVFAWIKDKNPKTIIEPIS